VIAFQISFPGRVRIHDEECDAIARALHHEAKEVSLLPAVSKIALVTT
jgi:hypothetical protein